MMDYPTTAIRLVREAIQENTYTAFTLAHMAATLADALKGPECDCGGTCGHCSPVETKSLTDFDPVEARKKFDATLTECARLADALAAIDACINLGHELKEQTKSVNKLSAWMPGSYNEKALGWRASSDTDEVDRDLAELAHMRESKVAELCGQCPDSGVCKIALS
jgi:hypothetical protein